VMYKHPRHILVVGAGFSGAVIAHELAAAGWKVLVIDRRRHLGGNCYTERDEETGVMLHKYGPHILHTGDREVWEYLNRLGEIRPFTNRVKAVNRHGVFSFPINLHTINQYFSRTMGPDGARELLDSVRVKDITEPQNFEEACLAKLGRELYEAFFKQYTIKQWGRDPKNIPASVADRLPLRFNYDDNYYHTQYQGIPVNGYTEIFERLLDSSNGNLLFALGSGYEQGMEKDFRYTFYTGPIDEFFSYKHGRLSYRTVEFQTSRGKGDIQGNAVLNYTDDVSEYTRSHEHKHFAPWESHEGSVLMFEFSKETGENDEPYYPVNTNADRLILANYQREALELRHIEFMGRLGSYKYLDMSSTVRQALDVARAWLRANR
jgi:UDP-galactopyranose mutase